MKIVVMFVYLSIYVHNNIAFIMSNLDGMQMHNVKDPSNPEFIDSYNIKSSAMKIIESDSSIIVLSADKGLKIYDFKPCLAD